MSQEEDFDFSKVTFYVPVHGNFSQVEHTAAFLHLAPGSRVFVYGGFNTEHDKMVRFYREDAEWAGCQLRVDTFSMEAVLRALAEEPLSRRVVFLLTASTNYPFGRAQVQMLAYLRARFPSRILDVFAVGHCMYGCESCGLAEHNVPVFFTRYHNGALPYTAADVRARFWRTPSGAAPRTRVLVCPTVGVETFMNNPAVLDELQSLAKELEPHDVAFAVKLHGFCFLADADGARPHALFTLSDADRAGARFLRAVFGTQVVPETCYNILPFFEAADIVVTDVCSSVPFEAQMFPHLTVIANDNAGTRAHDPQYVAMLNTFTTPTQLRTLLLSAVSGGTATHTVGAAGAAFFASKYGTIDGHEPARIAALRHWADGVRACAAQAAQLIDVGAELAAFRAHFDTIFSTQDVMNYLACGEEIPKAVCETNIFVGLNEAQLRARKIPSSLWGRLAQKIGAEVFDAGNSFQFAQLVDDDEEEEEDGEEHDEQEEQEEKQEPKEEEGEEEEEEETEQHLGLISVAEETIKKESDVFLIDHAWTTTLANAREQLATIPGLLDRMERLVAMRGTLSPLPRAEDGKEEDEEEDPERVLAQRVDLMYRCMWAINDEYVVRSPDGEDLAVWFVMDEVGTAIGHSDTPNCACVPFIDAKSGAAYSVMWPLRDIAPGELLTRDYTAGTTDPLARAVALLPYGPAVSALEPVDDAALAARAAQTQHEAEADAAARNVGAPPALPPALAELAFFERERGEPVRVWSDSKLLCAYLTRREFALVDDRGAADVLWQGTDDFRDYAALGAHVFVNQLPNEVCVCFKHRLAATVAAAYGGAAAVEWLPETYDLTRALPEFVARYRARAAAGADNHWIVKPFNAARSRDIVVTDDVACVVRLGTAPEPMIACKYVEQPACYEGRKYDLRFLVLARAARGWARPQFSLYKTFWIRFANRPYALADLWDYERHFTVMNYRAGSAMTHIHDTEFVPWFDRTHGTGAWDRVLAEVRAVLAQLFHAACAVGHIGGAEGTDGCTANSFAVYGIDLLLTRDLHVRLEEVNFGPDCTRACNYDNQFYNKVFGHFFFGELENVTRFL